MSVPRLRFKDVDEREFPEWDERPITDCLQLMTDFVANGSFESLKKNVVVYSENEYAYYVRLYDLRLRLGHLNQTYVDETSYKFLKKSFLKSGDILVANIGANAGEVWQVPLLNKPATIAPNMILLKVSKSTNESYLYYYLKSEYGEERIKNTIGGSGQPKVSKTELKTIKVKVPASLSEQTKIANFLTAIDEKITQLTQKHDLLKHYKKGVMQQIFSQKLRFKDEDGREFPGWEEKKLGSVANRVTRKNKENNKNVLTISAQQGLINQEEYFNKSVSAKDVTNYYLLHTGDFAYNKSYSNGYPMGAIKCLNRYEKGVVSTLYICFKFIEGNINSFFEHYFENGFHNSEIEKVAQEGARNHGLLNIGLDDFFNISLIVPSTKEQTKIANFLTAIDDKITQAQTQLDAVKQYKKGLLQQLFV